MQPVASSVPAPPGLQHVVLVHGALVDGSSWHKVIPLLEAAGLHVVAVQNPLTSLAADVAATRRALALCAGPVLLVGHSWGGVVITEAGLDPQVAGLVYLAGFAPAVGETLHELARQGPALPGSQHFVADAGGFVRITRQGLDEDLAPDLPAAERRLLYATQQPLAAAARHEPATVAAWQARPCWYLVAENDRIMSAALQHRLAARIGATTHTVAAGHLPMLAQPNAVANLLLAAARSVAA